MRNSNKHIVRKSTTVQSVSRALKILVCLSEDIHTITDISDHCRLGKSTVHRLLKTLEELHFVKQDPINQRYYFGFFINKLALEKQLSTEYLISCSIQEMEHLSEISNETIGLHIFMANDEILIHSILSNNQLLVTASGYGRKKQYSGSIAKVLLSQLEDEELQIIIEHAEINAETEHTITDKKVLMRQVQQIRERGYTFSIGERLSGCMSISAPIKNFIFPSALTILGPVNRLEPRASYFIKELKASANRVSNNIKKVATINYAKDDTKVKKKKEGRRYKKATNKT